MSTHRATVEWRSDGEFANGRYSRRHEWQFDGGTNVIASSSPAVVPAPMSDPAGVDPEEALVASTSSCHMLWFLALAQAEGIEIASYRDEAEGVMGRLAPGKIGLTRITLRPAIGFAGAQPEAAALERLHHQAHERCFIANSLKTEIVIEPR